MIDIVPTLVRFRFNKVTGEVEEFLVDDQDRNLSEAEHDRIAADVARFVVSNPRVLEVAPSRVTQPANSVGAALESDADGEEMGESRLERE